MKLGALEEIRKSHINKTESQIKKITRYKTFWIFSGHDVVSYLWVG